MLNIITDFLYFKIGLSVNNKYIKKKYIVNIDFLMFISIYSYTSQDWIQVL